MDWKTVGSKVSKVAPIIGGILGGPLGGAAGTLVSMIASEFGLSPEDTTPEKLTQIIEADPQALLKFREMEMTNKVELGKLALEEKRLETQDRADARARQVGSEKATGKGDYNLYIIAYLYITGFFVSTIIMTYLALSGRVTAEVPQYVVFLLGNLFGALTGGVTAMVQYFFGSSKGSYDKTAFMAQQASKREHDKA